MNGDITHLEKKAYMNRRHCVGGIFAVWMSGMSGGCAHLGFTTGSSGDSASSPAPAARPAQPSSHTGTRRSGTTSISDLKTLGKLLEHAGHPLSDAQINFLSELAPGPEFSRRMTEVLTDLQIEAISTTGRRRSR